MRCKDYHSVKERLFSWKEMICAGRQCTRAAVCYPYSVPIECLAKLCASVHNEIAGHVVLIRGTRNAYIFRQKKPLKERGHLGDVGIDGGTILSRV